MLRSWEGCSIALTDPPRPLAETDDRSPFDCGSESLNTWFHRHAWANPISGASRVNVITGAASGRIAGYVTPSAAQIERAFLPRPQQRNPPIRCLPHCSASLRLAKRSGPCGVASVVRAAEGVSCV
jgi:hypothetical protein